MGPVIHKRVYRLLLQRLWIYHMFNHRTVWVLILQSFMKLIPYYLFPPFLLFLFFPFAKVETMNFGCFHVLQIVFVH